MNVVPIPTMCTHQQNTITPDSNVRDGDSGKRWDEEHIKVNPARDYKQANITINKQMSNIPSLCVYKPQDSS